MTRLRVGVLGLSHDHVWSNLAALATGDLGQLVAAADPDPRLRERLQATHGGATPHVEYDALLERRDLDAVLVFADNRPVEGLCAADIGRDVQEILGAALLSSGTGRGVALSGRC